MKQSKKKLLLNKSIIYTILLSMLILLAPISTYKYLQAATLNEGENQQNQIIHKIDIKINGAEDYDFLRQTVKNIICLNTNEIYNIEKLKKAIERLAESGLLESIHVEDPLSTSEGIALSFILTPLSRVSDIVINKAFPLTESEVLKAMTLGIGDTFSKKTLDEQAKKIVSLLKREGWYNPKVIVSAGKIQKDISRIITVDIEKGEHWKIGNIIFKSKNNMTDLLLKYKLKTWMASWLPGRRLSQNKLDEDLKQISSIYRSKGYVDFQIESEIIRHKYTQKADILFNIKKGPKYKLEFSNNRFFFDFTLKKAFSHIFKNGNKNNIGVKKGIENVKNLYRGKGFLNATIDLKIIDDPPDTPANRKLLVTIDEDLPFRVIHLEIKGNKIIKKAEIIKNMLTKSTAEVFFNTQGSAPYVPEVLDEDIEAIKALYQSKGFNSVKITKQVEISKQKGTKFHTVDIYLLIEEGMQSHIAEIQFQNLNSLTEKEARAAIKLKSGQIFNKFLLTEEEKSVQTKLSETGYTHAKVTTLTETNRDNGDVKIVFQIEEGPNVKTGRVIITGNIKTQDKIILKQMSIKQGEPFRFSKLLETRNKISEIQSLDNVNITTIGFDRQDDEVELLVGVNEKRPYVFELGAGYDTERLLYSDILINNRNFAGLNLNIEAKAELSNIGYKIDGSITDQFFASFPVSSTTGISVETREELNKNFGARIWGASQNFSGNFQDKQVNINLGLSYENRQQYFIGAFDTYDRENKSARSVITVGPGLILKTTDSPVTPKKGVFLTTDITLSKGMENNTDDFIKYRLDARYYYSPLNSLTLAARSAFSLIQPYGGNNRVSEDQLFYLGGASTVRGFGENLLRRNAAGTAIGGRESMFGSLEARYDTGLNVNLSLFYDIGKVSDIPDYQESESFRDSLGIGLRYMTPIGLIGIVYGHKLNPENYESRGAFHFSMGYSF